MNKTKYRIIIAVLLVINIVLLALVFIDYVFNYRYEEWFSRYLNNDRYLVYVDEKDRDQIWIGCRDIEVYVQDLQNKKILANFHTRIDNNGYPLDAKNYYLESNDKYIQLKFFDYDGSICSAYRFYFEDYVD